MSKAEKKARLEAARAYSRKYYHSAKHQAYLKSEIGRARRRAIHKKFNQTEHGRAYRLKMQSKWVKTEAGKAGVKRYFILSFSGGNARSFRSKWCG